MLLRALASRSTLARRALTTAKPPDPKPHTMAAVGATAGTLGSLAGMGGGFVAIPLMTRLGVSQHTAHGTSLVGVVCTGAAGAAAYAADGAVDVKTAAVVAASGALPGAGRRRIERGDAPARARHTCGRAHRTLPHPGPKRHRHARQKTRRPGPRGRAAARRRRRGGLLLGFDPFSRFSRHRGRVDDDTDANQ